MVSHFTLGVEQEFQLVDLQTGQLTSRIHPLLDKGRPLLGDHIKPEMLQSVIEIITHVCSNTSELRADLTRLTESVARLVAAEGVALVSAGTHPMSLWQDQQRTINDRYAELEEEYQDVGRSILIFAAHIHVGLEHREATIPLMNQLRTWIPHLLAISANSPFWNGRNTGLKSYRAIVWRRFPRSGLPPTFSSAHEFDDYVQTLIHTGCIDNGKRIWWDIRPHPFFNTIEFRVCDMPPTLEDTLAIAAFCQALVAKLSWMHKHNLSMPVIPSHFIEENKWLVARYGLDARIVDFVQNRTISIRDSISATLDFIDDVVDDLGCRREIDYLRSFLADPRGTGADRQLAVYKATGSQLAVVRYLIEQTMQGLASPATLTDYTQTVR